MSTEGRRFRRILLRTTALCLLGGVLLATDGPHGIPEFDPVFTTTVCGKCHVWHNSVGGSLTNVEGNANLCMSCHSATGDASNFTMLPSDQAIPGLTGTSHRWDAIVDQTDASGGHGSSTPSDIRLSARIENGRIMCSTCHQQHTYVSQGYLGRRAIQPIPDATNTSPGRVIVPDSAFAGTAPTTYWIQITTAGDVGAAEFQWATEDVTGLRGAYSAPVTTAASNNLGDVTISFRDAPAAGDDFLLNDVWTFEAIVPYMRMEIDLNQMCEDCHVERVQTDVTSGVDVKSHPVGVALNSNGKNYDYGRPLDVDGGTTADATQVAAAGARTLSFTALVPEVPLTSPEIPPMITASSGNFLTDGYARGMTLIVTGSSPNAGTYTLAAVSADVLTINGVLSDEADVSSGAVATLNAAATATDHNASNDLPLFGGTVRCLTCHGVHHADSDSNTIDSPPAPN